jgi:hypothetical protein
VGEKDHIFLALLMHIWFLLFFLSGTVDVSDPLNYGFYMSPNHPGNYPGGSKCTWSVVNAAPEVLSKTRSAPAGYGSAWEQISAGPIGQRGWNRRRAGRPIRRTSRAADAAVLSETRVGFLRFKTSTGDAVGFFDADGEEPATAVAS